MNLFFGDGKMLYPVRNNYELSLFNLKIAIPETNQQTAFDDKKKLVFGFVMVPHELAFELHQLYKGIIYLAGNLRAPAVLKGVELLAQADSLDRCVFHGRSERRQARQPVSSKDAIALKQGSPLCILKLKVFAKG